MIQKTIIKKGGSGLAAAREGAQRRTFARGDEQRQYDHEVLDIARVVRVVKGGRRFSFRASVVAGDRAGKVGFGLGKSKDIQAAISKAYDQATKRMIKISLTDGSIPYERRAKFGGSRVMLKPAPKGTGLIAGGVVRTVADMAGIHDLVSKRLGSTNKVNLARATLAALESFKD
jgi:small subunit ribosomal protein S5